MGQDESASPALAVARRRWWIVVLTTIVAVAVAVAGLSVVTPTYQATTTLQTPIANGVQTPSDLTYVDRLMNTYTLLAQQASLRAEVARQLGVAKAPPLSVVVQPNTELLQLSASDRSAARAQLAANTAAMVLVKRVTALAKSTSSANERTLTGQLATLSDQITRERAQLASVPLTDTAGRLTLQQQISGDQANYQALAQQRAQLQVADATRDQTLSVIQSASLPTSPASPKWTPVLALALALGLLGGLALVFVVERFKPRLYTVEAIESAAEAEVLAAIPRVTGELAERGIYNGGSPAQEAFGVLAVHVLASKDRPRTILVTSRNKGDGKSTVASNLATELAKSGHEVLLVDADMRAPSLHKVFGIDDEVGLSSLLESGELSSMLDEFVVRPLDHVSLSVIPAGPAPDAPARLLASEAMGRLMAELVARYEFVVIDAPPLVVSDPLSVARMSDLVLLVVGGGAVPDRDIQAATRQLAGIGAENVSVVVNRWRGRDTRYSYSYGSSR